MTVGNIQSWALLGILAMLSSAIRCALSLKSAIKLVRQKLKRTAIGAVAMLVVICIIYLLAPAVSQLYLSVAIFVIVLVFVVYSSMNA